VRRAAAKRAGVGPLELDPPLYDAIDPAESDALLDSSDRPSRSPVEVTFHYHGSTVTVDGDLAVSLAE